jgi:thioredoxin 1
VKGEFMSALVNEVNAENFEAEVLKSADLVLIDFWAEWCGPCKRIAPTVESIAEKYQGKAKVFKMNVDENGERLSSFGIKGIPTLILFQNGRELERIVGAPSNAKESISEMIDKHLADSKDESKAVA